MSTTHSPVLQKRLLALCAARPEQVYTIEENGHGGLTFSLPKKLGAHCAQPYPFPCPAGGIGADEREEARGNLKGRRRLLRLNASLGFQVGLLFTKPVDTLSHL